ncbi:hypothetical protein RNJ44_03754 [Nakaseomyces bracarensis]|uniref:EF-hand domain-containing protein n=1 Tax=Nakaseomyces bracarensis TaxID=273131 RepID=A0ABR4NXX4_9SACH
MGSSSGDSDERYERLFKDIDLSNSGKVDLRSLQRAFKEKQHPLCKSEDALHLLFNAMDCNHDSVIDLEDFKKYARKAEEQIEQGFQRLDVDNDGKIKTSDVMEYLHYLTEDLAEENNSHILDEQLMKSRFKQFIKWAFTKKKQNDPECITYDQWRDFLLMMPREQGSRLHTAYAYFYLFNEDVDLSSEGDMTLINDFIKGFGFFIAGGISGVVSRTCTAPFDRLKVFLIARTDLSSTLLNSKEVVLAKNPHAKPNKLRSPLVKAIISLYRQGGIRSFYVGNGLNALKVFPESSIKFGSFEMTKKLMTKVENCKDTKDLSKFSTYIAGGLAGVCAQFSVYPIDTLKFRMQCAPLDTELKGRNLMFKTAKEMYKEGGMKLFYRGVLVGVLGIFPYAALDLGTFTMFKKYYIQSKAKRLNKREEDVELSNLVVLPMGALSGTFGATVVYPINLLRTRLQAQGTYAHPYRYDGFKDVLLKTIQREGYPGLFKGLVPTLAKVCPAVSISYLCYENLKKVMDLEQR